MDLQKEFAEFTAKVLDPARLSEVAAAADVDVDWLFNTTEISIAESWHTLRVVESRLRQSDRLLEVGSGLGVTSSFLASHGYDITSIEPGGSGFENYERVNPLLRASLGIDHTHHVVAVEEATPKQLGGTFELIFSNNVIEHVNDVERALTALAAALSDGGVMVHHCPNYRVPYEPHFGIPLIPRWPAKTAKILPRRISSTGLWASLNFVTARDAKTIAERAGASVEFERGVFADAVARLNEPEFGERHPLLRRLTWTLSAVDPAIRRIPAEWATPMTFTWHQAPEVPARSSQPSGDGSVTRR